MTTTRINLDTYENQYDRDLGRYVISGTPLKVRFDCYIPNYGRADEMHPTLHIYVTDPVTYDVVQRIEIHLPAGVPNLDIQSIQSTATSLQEEQVRHQIRSEYVETIDQLKRDLDAERSVKDPF